MARKTRKHRAPVHLRHKVLGSIFVILGLAFSAGCLMLASFLLDQFMEGYTWELIMLDLCLGVAGMVFFLAAWHQVVIAPKRDYLEEAFHPIRRPPPAGESR